MGNPQINRDGEVEQFLDALTRELGFLPTTQIRTIRAELAAHLHEMVTQREWEGLPPDEAWQEAMTAFGNPAIHAQALGKEWRTWQRRQWARRLFKHCNERKSAMESTATTNGTPPEVLSFTRSLSTLVDTGNALVPILDTLAGKENNPELKRAIQEMNTDLQNGKSMAGVMEKYPQLFSPQYIAVFRQGELAGQLELALTLLASVGEGWTPAGQYLFHPKSASG